MKPENVLLVSNKMDDFRIKIADLGFAQEFDREKGYGYLNWVRNRPDMVKIGAVNQSVKGYFAYGHRGQFIGVYPELDLLVITMADATDATRDTFFVPDLLHDYVRRFVFPSIIQ